MFEDDYRAVVALFVGASVGGDGELLRGFGKWLASRSDLTPSISWPTLVLWTTFPDFPYSGGYAAMRSDQQRPAIESLFALMREFHSVDH